MIRNRLRIKTIDLEVQRKISEKLMIAAEFSFNYEKQDFYKFITDFVNFLGVNNPIWFEKLVASIQKTQNKEAIHKLNTHNKQLYKPFKDCIPLVIKCHF